METYRPKTALVFGLVVAFLAVFGLFSAISGSSWQVAVESSPLVALLIFTSWAVFMKPAIRVGEEGVEINNVLRSHKLSWGAIERIDTRWALTIFASQKKFTAWSAPAPGRHAGFLANREQGEHLPESSYLAGTIRPGDLINTDSGVAAAHIRRIWDQKKHQNLSAEVSSRWHLKTIAVFCLLLTLTIFGFF